MNEPGTIFVVDDDASFRTAITRLLRIVGFRVHACASGAELLAGVLPETRGCVLADLHMPGQDGWQLEAELRRAGVTMPVIILTGDGDATLHGPDGGGAGVVLLEKRSGRNELLSAIQRALARDEAERARRTAAGEPARALPARVADHNPLRLAQSGAAADCQDLGHRPGTAAGNDLR
jgi:FixJ family two-component response regulator